MTIIIKDSNDYNAKELFDSRETFKNKTYNHIVEKNKDILYEHFFENQFYGKVDSYGNSIFVSEKFLKGLKNPNNSLILAQDFVAYAFSDLADYFKSAYRLRKIKREGSPLAQIQPANAFSSMHKAYANYLSNVNLVLIEYLKELKLEKSILRFEDYTKYFLNFLSSQKGLIIFTRSKFIKSKFTNHLASGLSISLDGESHDNDLAKYNKFALDPNFQFFLESCRRFCFLVDKNAPWTIHFDLVSVTDQRSVYFNKFGIKDVEDVYNKRFYKAFFTDIKILKTFLHHAYTSFILNDSNLVKITDVKECGSPIIMREERQEVTLSDVETKFEDMFWFKLYFNIRLLEEQIELNEAKHRKVLLDTENILKYGTGVMNENKFISALVYLNSFIISNTKQFNVQKLLTF